MTSTTDVIGAASVDDNPTQLLEVEPAPFTVLGSNIIVELVQRDNTTDSGIVLVKEKEERPPDVVVVGFGADAVQALSRHDVRLALGKVLIVRKHDLLGLRLSEDDRQLYVVQPDAIIGLQ